jgi:hypothetical protein
MERNLYYYEYVGRPAAELAARIEADPSILVAPTETAIERAEALVGRLHFHVGGFEVGRDVSVEVGPVSAEPGAAHFPVRWRAASRSSLFPHMEAEITVEDVCCEEPVESRLTLAGTYTPPLGPLGAVGDLLLGHQVAEATVRAFVLELAQRLQAAEVRRPRLRRTG